MVMMRDRAGKKKSGDFGRLVYSRQEGFFFAPHYSLPNHPPLQAEACDYHRGPFPHRLKLAAAVRPLNLQSPTAAQICTKLLATEESDRCPGEKLRERKAPGHAVIPP